MTLLKSLNLRNVESPLLTPSASGHKNIRDEENKKTSCYRLSSSMPQENDLLH